MRKGIQTQVIGNIEEIYTNIRTTISVGGKTTREIRINLTVKQGCPLSPFLFNLEMDDFIEKLKLRNIGVKVNETLLNLMAFANELLLITEEFIHLKILLEDCKEFFEMKGLKVNTGKCASLGVLHEKGKRSMKMTTRVHRQWGTIDIPSINFEDLLKYLEVDITPMGDVRLLRKKWEGYLQNITKCKLNPIQKIQETKQVITAKIQ